MKWMRNLCLTSRSDILFSLRQRELRQSDDLAPFECRFVRADTHAGPVCRLHRVGVRIAAVDECIDKLMREMRMRSAMSAALCEGEVLFLVVVVNSPPW